MADTDTDHHLTTKQRIERGVAAWDRDDYQAALSDFRVVLTEHPDFPDVRNKAGLCLAMLGDLTEALDQLDAAVRIAPGYAEAHLNRAIVLNSLGRFDEAEAAFRRAGELDRRNTGRILSDIGNRIAVTHAKLGDLYMMAEHYDEAASQYEQALDVRPSFLDVRTKLAEALIQLDELDRARKELAEILEQNPAFTSARLRLGVVHNRQGRRKEALREWERCAEEDPKDLRARAYIAAVRSSE